MFTNAKECIEFIEHQQRKSSKSLIYFQKLCEFYGSPNEGLKFIHVAGTNGKGSVVAYMRSILEDAGLVVGSFTSPYIECFNERIYFNNHFILDEEIIKYTNIIISKYDELEKKGIEKPGFFAFVTLMCFLYFKDVKPDICIIEVGIGGLLDSTNIITPLLSIITNVSYDHMNILGDTLSEIGYNKLGIVKENTPLVTIKNQEIHDLIIDTCKNKNSDVVIVNPKLIKNITIEFDLTTFSYKNYHNVELKMLGKYQTENATLAIEASQILKKHFNITDENIMNGLKNTFWPGRLEVVCKNPLIILDGAHNIDGFNRLHEFIKSIKAQNKISLVIAISSNKEKQKMINEIEKDVDKIYFTEFSYKRSDTAKDLYSLSNHKNKLLCEDFHMALEYAKSDFEKNTIWIFCGSLYFISEIRKEFV